MVPQCSSPCPHTPGTPWQCGRAQLGGTGHRAQRPAPNLPAWTEGLCEAAGLVHPKNAFTGTPVVCRLQCQSFAEAPVPGLGKQQPLGLTDVRFLPGDLQGNSSVKEEKKKKNVFKKHDHLQFFCCHEVLLTDWVSSPRTLLLLRLIVPDLHFPWPRASTCAHSPGQGQLSRLGAGPRGSVGILRVRRGLPCPGTAQSRGVGPGSSPS